MRKKDPYIIRYRPVWGELGPLVRFGLSSNGQTVTVEAYADSGASYSIFHPIWSQRLGIPYPSGRRVFVRIGSGALIPLYLHRLRVMIGHFSFPATVGFSNQLGVGFNILGRRDLFKKLSFTFNDRYGFLLIRDAHEVEEPIKTRLGLN